MRDGATKGSSDEGEQGGSLRGLPVLIVDDDPASAKLMQVLLQGEGCDTRTVENAEHALVVLSEFAPRVIVLDLVLPMMSGFMLAQRIKADPRTRDAVIIAVTGFNGGAIAQASVDAGCAACVRKPIEPASFIQLVLTHLGRNS